ncbi:sulfur oxidation c-type cytochrome SoxX [Pseudogemmobacter humi]|uniref:Cytochrome c n=1 Tax=Pseudogemmobacter humi TaxID=2483812 RepID=A0A3P5WGM8_9RHOB|nr:sulfur oxidation c-type cytochrome SoxX [Pseudogemmobacter humi]VDC19839.1 Cytochrome c [Pseudogemmobacter humi]
MVRYHHLTAIWLICAGPALSPALAQQSSGAELIRDSAKGNCSICHVIPGIGLPEEAQGDIGPSLAGVGGRLTEAELRARIIDARKFNPQTVMPPYGTNEGMTDVNPRYRGKPILTEGEIHAIAGWLAMQK